MSRNENLHGNEIDIENLSFGLENVQNGVFCQDYMTETSPGNTFQEEIDNDD